MNLRSASPKTGILGATLSPGVNWYAIVGLVIILAVGAGFWTAFGWLIAHWLP